MLEKIRDSTLSVTMPDWNSSSFVDVNAQVFWLELPPILKALALIELNNGKSVAHILRNNGRHIVLLAFNGAPTGPPPDQSAVRGHTAHAYGNYCYDDTLCTYEHIESGCFLAFTKPLATNAL